MSKAVEEMEGDISAKCDPRKLGRGVVQTPSEDEGRYEICKAVADCEISLPLFLCEGLQPNS